MPIINIKGGLGNQMYQYALAKNISQKYNTQLVLDISGYETYKLHKYCLEVFHIEKNYATKENIPFYINFSSKNKLINIIYILLRKFFSKINPKHYLETSSSFDKNFLKIKAGYIEGYFAKEDYFIANEKLIRKDFSFKIPPSQKNKNMIEVIKNCNSVSLHIRRGDFVTNQHTNDFHGTCDLNYYKRAILHFTDMEDSPTIFFFSDDINWVKQNLITDNESHYVDFNNASTNYEDLRLMSLCKHNIIANSTFSWWGAWLNSNKDKIVIAPKRWFNDEKQNAAFSLPENWLRL